MTNIEGEESTTSDPRLATIFAVHFVSRILNEACVIVNDAKNSGTSSRNLNNSKFNEIENNTEVKVEYGINVMATSTPQKVTEEIIRIKINENCIGQGDEDFYGEQNELRKSTSTLITHLFDMSTVECIYEDIEINQSKAEQNFVLFEYMMTIIEFCLKSAFANVYENIKDNTRLLETDKERKNDSNYTVINESIATDLDKNIAFYVHQCDILEKIENDTKNDTESSRQLEIDAAFNVNIQSNVDTNSVDYGETEVSRQPLFVLEKEMSVSLDPSQKYVPECIKKLNPEERISNNEVFNENAYLTLNRDYEQYSDEEQSVCQDSKFLGLQDVDLNGGNSSVKFPSNMKLEKKRLAATSAVSAPTNYSRGSTIFRRCRLQGARLLACLRGWWWRRKLPGRRKEPRTLGAVRGQCPLSPIARRRSSSLLSIGHRRIRSPSPSGKFNTINETMVDSDRWKDYAFQHAPDCNDL